MAKFHSPCQIVETEGEQTKSLGTIPKSPLKNKGGDQSARSPISPISPMRRKSTSNKRRKRKKSYSHRGSQDSFGTEVQTERRVIMDKVMKNMLKDDFITEPNRRLKHMKRYYKRNNNFEYTLTKEKTDRDFKLIKAQEKFFSFAVESELIKMRTKYMLWDLFERQRLKVGSRNMVIGGLYADAEGLRE